MQHKSTPGPSHRTVGPLEDPGPSLPPTPTVGRWAPRPARNLGNVSQPDSINMGNPLIKWILKDITNGFNLLKLISIHFYPFINFLFSMVPLLDLHLTWALETASGGKSGTKLPGIPQSLVFSRELLQEKIWPIWPNRSREATYAKSAKNWLVTPPVLQANSCAKRTPGLPQDSRKWSRSEAKICKIIVNQCKSPTYTISYTDCNYMILYEPWSKPKWAGSCHSVPSAPHSQALDGWAFRSATSARRRVQRCPIPRCRLGTGHGRGSAHRRTTTGEYDIAWYSLNI